MDKKNTTIGVALLIAAMGLLFFQQRFAPKPPPVEERVPAASEQASGERATTTNPPPAQELSAVTVGSGELPSAAAATVAPSLFEHAEDHEEGETIEALGNDFIEVHFTNKGGAMAEFVLKKYPEEKNSADSYVLNGLRAAPALSLLDFQGADRNATYRLVEKTSNSITWRTQVGDQLEVTRTYSIEPGGAGEVEPYLIHHETTFRNLLDQAVNTPNLEFSLGTAEPINEKDPGYNLNVGVYDGDDAEFVGRADFSPGFFKRTFAGDTETKQEIRLPINAVWGSVKNQFFAMVATPDEPGVGVTTRRVEFPLFPGELKPRVGITGSLLKDPVRLEPGASHSFAFDFYAGPKEYNRLVEFGKRQDLVMQFGFFGFFSKILLTLLKALYGFVGNWGLAIVLTTLILRTMMWPITASAARSAKRMGTIQGPMKEVQEKYKDNKQKQQEEMLKLFKQNKINPLGGCLPMFIQLPIFFGLFSMLRSASELRFAEFLWVGDLSAPDTIAHIAGFPINLMPLLMGASMVVQMRMTPTPSTDNASAKMMKFMPYMVTALCYNFSSGLAVYWTASNLFSVFQQWVTNRRKDPVLVAAPADNAKAGKAAKAAKQVNPAKQPRLGPKGLPSSKKKKKR